MTMAQSWFSDLNAFGAWYGAVVGGVGGDSGRVRRSARPAREGAGLDSGRLGGVYRVRRPPSAGLFALIGGQPREIRSPFMRAGGMYAAVIEPLYPKLRRQYREAEERRIEAASIRGRRRTRLRLVAFGDAEGRSPERGPCRRKVVFGVDTQRRMP
jgi:hypothetical protein